MYQEREFSDALLFLNNDHEPANDLLPAFDLPGLIQLMKNDRNLGKREPNSMILYKTQEKTILLLVLNPKIKIESYQSNRSISFRVIEGRLNLHIRNGSLTIKKGELLILNEKTNYSLESMEETVFLLTLESLT